MLERFYTDNFLRNRYIKAGSIFGDDVSYVNTMGECIEFESHFKKWARLEKEYVKRGFTAWPIDDFIRLGGYGKPLPELTEKNTTLHAERYREKYLHKITPMFDFLRANEVQTGIYESPTTKDEQ